MTTNDTTGRTHPGYQLSDVDRRAAEQVEEAWPILARFVTGTEPAQIVADLSVLASTIEHAANVAGARLTRKPEHEAEAMVRAMFRKDRTGLGLVTINTDPDKAHRAINWAGLESDPEWCPVIGFAEVTPGGIVEQAISRHRWPMLDGKPVPPRACAVMVRPQTMYADEVVTLDGDRMVRAYRPTNGLIFPKKVGDDWLPGAEVVGIVRVYADLDQAEADRDDLARAVTAVTNALRPATEPDQFDTEDDRPGFVAIG